VHPSAAGSLQFCASQTSGVEAAIHSMRSPFTDKNSGGGEVYLLMLAIHLTVQLHYRTSSAYSTNMYHYPAPLYIC